MVPMNEKVRKKEGASQKHHGVQTPAIEWLGYHTEFHIYYICTMCRVLHVFTIISTSDLYYSLSNVCSASPSMKSKITETCLYSYFLMVYYIKFKCIQNFCHLAEM